MIRSKLSLSKKLANSMILANDLCQPSVHNVTQTECQKTKVGGLDVETNRDQDRERP